MKDFLTKLGVGALICGAVGLLGISLAQLIIVFPYVSIILIVLFIFYAVGALVVDIHRRRP